MCKTRYGCIKKGCKAKLYMNANHDEESIQLLEPHTCLKSTHQTIGKKIIRQLCKNNAASGFGGSPKVIFEATCQQ